MSAFALNHMTVARLGFARLADLTARLGCDGVELRDDLGMALFDGLAPEAAGEILQDMGLSLYALAEVKRFNDWSEDKAAEARELIAIASRAGAGAVALIPANDGVGADLETRQKALHRALTGLRPLLEEAGLLGYVEPLGFESSSLRHKTELVEVIDSLGAADRFRIVHDTFHHHLAGGGPLFPELTGIVHISGVEEPGLAVSDMRDGHRVLVGDADRLGNVAQIRALRAGGFDGPLSFECFAPSVHELKQPKSAIAHSMAFVRAAVAEEAA